MNRLKPNQSGLSSILFAMVFATVLSLLAIGFATLARNDQRQALDQSLGYQAQYAAETAINQLQAEIAENGKLDPSTNNNCDNGYDIASGSGARVTCVKWTNTGPTVKFSNVAASPESIQAKMDNSPTSMIITWKSLNPADVTYSGVTDGTLPSDISDANIPILRIAAANSDGSSFRQFYLVPINSGGSSGITYENSLDGLATNVGCPAKVCTVTLDFSGDSFVNDFVAVSTIGGAAEEVIFELTGANFVDVQYTIDANAVAQDVAKRAEARIRVGSDTWRPGFAVNAEKLCKDIKIDGTNGSSVSSGGTVCP